MTETAEQNATHAEVKSDIAKPRLLDQVQDILDTVRISAEMDKIKEEA